MGSGIYFRLSPHASNPGLPDTFELRLRARSYPSSNKYATISENFAVSFFPLKLYDLMEARSSSS